MWETLRISSPIDFVCHHQDIILKGLKILLLIFLIYNAVQEIMLLVKALYGTNIWFSDFFAIWSYANFTVSRQPINIYNNLAIQEMEFDLGGDPSRMAPCFYPPSFLMYIAPLGILSFYKAFALWVITSFVLYLFASIYKQMRRPYAILIIILAPATMVGIITGQTGLLASALMVGGFQLVRPRPVLAGIVFGLASFKPQFGLLIPIALISAREWKTLVWAILTVFALVVVSGIAFGWPIWLRWLAKLPEHGPWVAHLNERFQPTIFANLSSLGVNTSTAWIVQVIAAIVVAVLIWVCFRRGVTNQNTAALFVGTFLATPYAFVYDMQMLTNAVLYFPRRGSRTRGLLAAAETLTRVSVLLLPNMMAISYKLSMIRSIPLIIFFGLIVWRILRSRRQSEDRGYALEGRA